LAEDVVATEIKIWEIADKKISPVQDTSLASQHVEDDLETWITQDPSILGDELLVIDRQWEIPGVGRLDLLCVDKTGKLIIVELKRDRSPRDAVAQALDYASWLNEAGPEEILGHAKGYLHLDPSEVFEAHFHAPMPDLSPQNHKVLIVASRLDSSAERIVNYLRERHGIEFNVLLFKYAKVGGEREVLIRTLLLPESTQPLTVRRLKQQEVEDYFREKVSTFAEAAVALNFTADAVETKFKRLIQQYPEYFKVFRHGDTISLVPTDEWFKEYGSRVYEGTDPKVTYFQRFPEKARQSAQDMETPQDKTRATVSPDWLERSGGSWAGLVDAEKLTRDIYESRLIQTRPAPQL
jgi:Endonuclease NucS